MPRTDYAKSKEYSRQWMKQNWARAKRTTLNCRERRLRRERKKLKSNPDLLARRMVVWTDQEKNLILLNTRALCRLMGAKRLSTEVLAEMIQRTRDSIATKRGQLIRRYSEGLPRDEFGRLSDEGYYITYIKWLASSSLCNPE